MSQDPYNFEEEAYKVEAQIIAQYMLAGDEALGGALGDAMKSNIKQAMQSIWKEPDIVAAFNENLRSHLIKQANTLAGKVEQEHLNREIAAALGKQWGQHFKAGVDDAVRRFLEGDSADLSPGQKKAVAGSLKQTSLEQLLENAVRTALEMQLQAGLKDAILKAVQTQLTAQQLRRITGEVVKGDMGKSQEKTATPWFQQPAILSMAGVALLLILVIWGNMSNRSAISQLHAAMNAPQNSSVQQPVQSQKEPPVEKKAKPAPEPVQTASVQDPLLAVWLKSVKLAGSEPDGFAFLAQNGDIAFQTVFGFQDAGTLKADVAAKKGKARRDLFLKSPLLNFKDAKTLAASLSQKLVREVAVKDGGGEGWTWLKSKPANYLENFKADGDFGPGSIALTQDFLRWLKEDPSQFNLDRTGADPSGFLLISYLALEALAPHE